MTPEQWYNLKPGDRIHAADDSTHIYTVYGSSGGVVVITIIGIISSPEEWVLLHDAPEAAKVPPKCLMCSGSRVISLASGDHTCLRCEGTGEEPIGLNESIFEIRIFQPADLSQERQMIMTGRQPYTRAMAIAVLENALEIFRNHKEETEITRQECGECKSRWRDGEEWHHPFCSVYCP